MSAPPASDIFCIPSIYSTTSNSKQKQNLPHLLPRAEELHQKFTSICHTPWTN